MNKHEPFVSLAHRMAQHSYDKAMFNMLQENSRAMLEILLQTDAVLDQGWDYPEDFTEEDEKAFDELLNLVDRKMADLLHILNGVIPKGDAIFEQFIADPEGLDNGEFDAPKNVAFRKALEDALDDVGKDAPLFIKHMLYCTSVLQAIAATLRLVCEMDVEAQRDFNDTLSHLKQTMQELPTLQVYLDKRGPVSEAY